MGQVDNGTNAGRLTIDALALRSNFSAIADRVCPAAVGAVVKADAYGLGAGFVAPLLAAAGCRDFFVAHLGEALILRYQLPASARLYVLNGVSAGAEASCAEARIIPVINSIEQARRWIAATSLMGERPPAAIQIDSGMARLGLSSDEVAQLVAEVDFGRELNVALVMSHLACADDPANPANASQRAEFERLASLLPPARRSLANSGAAFMDARFHCDLVRVGLCLYGCAPHAQAAPWVRAVLSLSAPVIQLRSIPAGQGVGYGLRYRAHRPSRLATLGLGYADGWPRHLAGRGAAYHSGVRLPIVGDISMDSLVVDATALPEESLGLGEHVELIGPHQSIGAVAGDAGTIPYEILTRLGRRFTREWRA